MCPVPKGADFKVEYVPDVLQWLQLRNMQSETRSFQLTEQQCIEHAFVDAPQMVVDIKLKRRNIKAVVVAEHRNIQANILSFRVLNRNFDKILFILVSPNTRFFRRLDC